MVTTSDIFQATIRSKHLERAFRRAPTLVFPLIRDQVFRIVAGFRKRWLAAHRVEFTRGPGFNFPLLSKVPASLPTGPKGGQAKRIVFVVVPPKGASGKSLADIRAEVFTISKAWKGLEEGGTQRPKRASKLAIPIGVTKDVKGRVIGRWNTPEKFTRANKSGKQKVLVAIFNPTNGTTILYWQKPVGAGRKKHYVYLPAYLLADKVDTPRLLHFYKTWDAERGNRAKVAKQMLQKIQDAFDKAAGRG